MEYDDSELANAIIRLYMKGKPDTEGWRRVFKNNGLVVEDKDFISRNGQIYPLWAIEEGRRRGFKIPFED